MDYKIIILTKLFKVVEILLTFTGTALICALAPEVWGAGGVVHLSTD